MMPMHSLQPILSWYNYKTKGKITMGKNGKWSARMEEVMVVDKVVPYVLVDGGSGLNILLEDTMKKLGRNLTGPSPFIINMANQTLAVPLRIIQDCRIST